MWSYQGMAHGCNSLMYFRYRGAVKGAEQFCYGVIDADNQKRRKFYEVQNFFNSISQYRSALDSPIKTDAAIVYNYESLAAFRIQSQSILLDPVREMQRIYKEFYDNSISVDIIPSAADIENYKILVLSQMIIVEPTFRARVQSFVENGGILIMTYRTAVKDTDNNLKLGEMLPIGFNQIAGVTVEEVESLQEYDAFPISGQGEYDGQNGYGGIFRDMLIPSTAEVLYNYDDKFYKDFAAITRNIYGKGVVYYLGTTPDEKTLNSVLNRAIFDAGLPKCTMPDGVESVCRGDGNEKIKFLINHNDFEVVADGITLNPFEVKIV